MALITGRAGTRIGPLTTTWTMPDSCTVHLVNCVACTEGWRGQQCVGTAQVSDHTTCWPPAMARVLPPSPPFHGWGFYSPGLACPAGYTTACTAQYGRRPEWEIEFTLLPGETAVGCCPEGFRCGNNYGNTCIAIASPGTSISVTTAMCSGSGFASVKEAVFPDVITTTVTNPTNTAATSGLVQTVTRVMTLLAPMFQLNYQSSDLLPPSTSTSGFSSSTPAGPSSSTIFTTGPTSAPSLPADSPGGISTGAVIGISVGSAIGCIFLIAAVGCLWLKKRRQTETAAGSGATNWASGGGTWTKPSLLSGYTAQGWPPSEMDATGRSVAIELPAHSETGRGH